jgi:membrane protein implicated in regulation of membrane protease activity
MLGTLAQGFCFGIGLFPVLLLLAWSLQIAWQLGVVVAAIFALGKYMSNRWKHNRPERFLVGSRDRP